jgi:hypothetical protein
MTQKILDPQQAARLRRRRVIISVIVASIAVHFIAAILAGIWIVARYLLPTPATFEVKKEIRIAAEERQHRMNMDEFDALKPKPTFQDKMATARPAEFSLPDLPPMPLEALSTIDPSDIVSDQLDSLVGAAGAGSGSGTGGGGRGGISFLGVTSTGSRVVLLFDVATTVVKATERAGMPMEAIKNKTIELLDSLSINTTFGLAQFARGYAFFNSELLPASDPNRARAKTWLDDWFSTSAGFVKGNTPGYVGGGPGFLKLLTEAFELKPDLIFIISDGDFFRTVDGKSERITYDEINRTLRELQEAADEPATINFVGVGMKRDNRNNMRRIISQRGNGGRFRELEE